MYVHDRMSWFELWPAIYCARATTSSPAMTQQREAILNNRASWARASLPSLRRTSLQSSPAPFIIYSGKLFFLNPSDLMSGLTMALCWMVIPRIWDLYVTNSVLTGWWLTRINPFSTSLLCAWVVFLCDLVYIVDALARTSKSGYRTSILASTAVWRLNVSHGTTGTTIEMLFSAVKCFIFVPYHFLVILDLNFTGCYTVMCALRLVRLLQAGRWNINFASTLSSATKNAEQSTQDLETEQTTTMRQKQLKRKNSFRRNKNDTSIRWKNILPSRIMR